MILFGALGVAVIVGPFAVVALHGHTILTTVAKVVRLTWYPDIIGRRRLGTGETVGILESSTAINPVEITLHTHTQDVNHVVWESAQLTS